MATLAVRTHGDRLLIGRLDITFQRTLRIPDDGTTYPLPPGLGQFPIRKVEDYANRVAESWRRKAASSFRCISVRRCGCRFTLHS
jgi:hypothetical protein